jgi:hypothetical protein
MIWVPPTYSIKLLFEDDVANVRLVEGDERLSNCKNREKNYLRPFVLETGSLSNSTNSGIQAFNFIYKSPL